MTNRARPLARLSTLLAAALAVTAVVPGRGTVGAKATLVRVGDNPDAGLPS